MSEQARTRRRVSAGRGAEGSRAPARGSARASAAAAGGAARLRLPEINRVILGGRLTRDPDTGFAGDGTPITTLALAFHRRYRKRDGQPGEETGYITVRTYQRLAEVCGQRLRKGSPVLVEGRLQVREWQERAGTQPTRLEIRAESVHFMEPAPDTGG